MRICIIRNKDGTISCLPVSKDKDYYNKKFNVVCFVNKMWNYYFVDKIKKYFNNVL